MDLHRGILVDARLKWFVLVRARNAIGQARSRRCLGPTSPLAPEPFSVRGWRCWTANSVLDVRVAPRPPWRARSRRVAPPQSVTAPGVVTFPGDLHDVGQNVGVRLEQTDPVCKPSAVMTILVVNGGGQAEDGRRRQALLVRHDRRQIRAQAERWGACVR